MESNEFVDRCLQRCGGGNSKFQKIFATLLCFIFGCQSMFIFGFGFFEMIPQLKCFKDDSQFTSQCSRTEACSSDFFYEIDFQSRYTISNWITKFNLVCAPEYMISLLGSLMFFGLLVGSICISRLGDIIGRKKVLGYTVFASSVSLIGIILSSNLQLLYIFIFLFGTTAAPRYALSYIYALEIVSSQHEPTYTMLAMAVDSLAMVIFGIFFQFVKDMVPLLWFLVAFQTLLIIIALIYIPESPKYLYDKGDLEGCMTSLQQIAKFNNQEVDISELKGLSQNQKPIQTYDVQSDSSTSEEDRAQTKKHDSSMKQFITNPIYFKNAMVLFFCWGVGAYSFYFTEFYMDLAPVSDIFTLSFLLGLSDLFISFVFKILITWFPIKKVLGMSFLILACIALAFSICQWFNIALTPSTRILYTIFILGIRLSGGTGFGMSYYANTIYFPPVLKAGIFAITNIAARLASVLSPVVAEYVDNPCITIAIGGIIVSVLTIQLQLPTTVQTSKRNQMKV